MLVVLLFGALQIAAATPSPAPTPTPQFELRVSGSNTFIDQATGGPGTTPPEARGFSNGSPISPMSPYDWFSGAPVTPGVAGIAQYELTGVYHATGVDLGATLGLGALAGSTTNAAYCGEPLIPNLDVHDLSRAVPYAIIFPTHAGADDAGIVNAALLSASATAADKSWEVRGGYFDLAQSDRFVFAPPPITSTAPSLGPVTAETLGPGMPAIDNWSPSPSTLPLLGADGIFKRGAATIELSDALLPALPGTTARLTMGSLVWDRGDDGRFSIQMLHAWTGGGPITTTAFFGTNQTIDFSDLGRLYTSNLEDQRQTIGGTRAFFHPARGWDALVELGRAWYNAGLVQYPGTGHFGNYEHFSLASHLGKNDAATLEFHRFDPTYATMILPYGVPENVWSIAWAWPGVWLKSTYQLVDNSVVGANRAGFRFKFDHSSGRLEVHASAGDWRQLQPETFANASQVGFVDGFFLLQRTQFATLGEDRQLGLYTAWHMPDDDFALDAVDDFLSRAADLSQPVDAVSIRAPQAIASWTHHFSKKLLVAGGYGRYESAGIWSLTQVSAIYGVAFAGTQFATGPNTALLIEARRYGLTGLPSMPSGLPPNMRGTSLIVDQRVGL